MPRKPLSFRINSKSVFLSYPRCSLSKEHALEALRQLPLPIPPKYIGVAQEQHQDGTPHLHCLVQFSGWIDTSNQRLFDLPHPQSSTWFHGNYQAAMSSTAAQEYISKYADYIDWGEYVADGQSKRISFHDRINEVYATALAQSDKSSAMAMIKSGVPRDYDRYYARISRNLDRIFYKPPEPYKSPFSIDSFNNVPDVLNDWVAENVMAAAARPCRPISIIIEGGTRLGKTAWARSLGPHNYLSERLVFNSEVYSNDAWYNVVDNIEPSYLSKKHWKELLGAKHDWQANCKYAKPVQIKGGIPTIVLCNPGKESSYITFLDKKKNAGLRTWTEVNAVITTITRPLFTEAQERETGGAVPSKRTVN